MSLTDVEWQELLWQPEMYVDLQRVRSGARHGLSQSIRADVWRYLVHIAHPDKSDEMTRLSALDNEFNSISKQNNIVSRSFRRFLVDVSSAFAQSSADLYTDPDCILLHPFSNQLVSTRRLSRANANEKQIMPSHHSHSLSGSIDPVTSEVRSFGSRSGQLFSPSGQSSASSMYAFSIFPHSISQHQQPAPDASAAGATLAEKHSLGHSHSHNHQRHYASAFNQLTGSSAAGAAGSSGGTGANVIVQASGQSQGTGPGAGTVYHLPSYALAWRNRLITQSLERILSAFHNTYPFVPFDVNHLYLATMMMVVFAQSERDAYFAYVTLRKWLSCSPLFEESTMKYRVSKFLMLFRCTQPRLYEAFLEEEVAMHEWAVSWIKYWLLPQLTLAASIRLWDTYLAMASDSDREELHMCVCLAILASTQESMREFDYSEITSFLHELPEEIDMNKMLERAYNIREYIRSRNLL
eukprot:ANDGO_06149.mRNA.1 ankyrin repeat-containing protein